MQVAVRQLTAQASWVGIMEVILGCHERHWAARELLTLIEVDTEVRWMRFTPDGRLLVGTHRGDGHPSEVFV